MPTARQQGAGDAMTNKDAHDLCQKAVTLVLVHEGMKRAIAIVHLEMGRPLMHPIAVAALDRLQQRLQYEIDNGPLTSTQMKEGG